MVGSALRPRVFGSGLVALDLVVGGRSESAIRYRAGGTCGNVLCILSWLGWEAYPVARMNGDAASERIRADLRRWGVRLDWTTCAPTAHTPMVVHEILSEGEDGPKHRFSWSCPRCGGRLPAFRPVTIASVESVKRQMGEASVFFFDRASRGILVLAAEAASRGAVLVFEPTARSDSGLAAEAISMAHVVKYSHAGSAGLYRSRDGRGGPLLEVQTLGHQGLRYRHRLGRTGELSRWMHQMPFIVPQLVDTCGSGDWCTAGLIAMTSMGGQEGLRKIGDRGVRFALAFGQALAAWNCSFEGARGGMYVVDRSSFDDQITRLFDNGYLDEIDYDEVEDNVRQEVMCPSCSTGDSGTA